MKGVIIAAILFLISFTVGQLMDQLIDNSLTASSGLVLLPLNALKLLIGMPTDATEFLVKIVLLFGIAAIGEAI